MTIKCPLRAFYNFSILFSVGLLTWAWYGMSRLPANKWMIAGAVVITLVAMLTDGHIKHQGILDEESLNEQRKLLLGFWLFTLGAISFVLLFLVHPEIWPLFIYFTLGMVYSLRKKLFGNSLPG